MKAWFFLLVFLMSGTDVFSAENPTALVIVDMQDAFVNRLGVQDEPENKKKVERVLLAQKLLIEVAKTENLPIVIAEYVNSGETRPEILSAISDYPLAFRVQKNTDGLLDARNASFKLVTDQLKIWGVKNLLVVGANGGACVEMTIKTARELGYDAIAYAQAIADFNSKEFAHPYYYAPDDMDLNAEGDFIQSGNRWFIYSLFGYSRFTRPRYQVPFSVASQRKKELGTSPVLPIIRAF